MSVEMCFLKLSDLEMRVGTKPNHNLDKIWHEVEDGMCKVFSEFKMGRTRYIELYTHVYNYCTSSNSNPSKKPTLGNKVRKEQNFNIQKSLEKKYL